MTSPTTSAADHTTTCGWQFEQYPHECDCGQVTGKLGEVTVDRQTFEAMMAVLYHKAGVFRNYGTLHAGKKTEDGDSKALANRAHAADIIKVLSKAGQALASASSSKDTPHLNMLDALCYELQRFGQEPAAFVVTVGFGQHLAREVRAYTGTSEVRSYAAASETLHLSYKSLPIYRIDKRMMHAAAVCCTANSPILAMAKQALAQP